MIPRFKSLPLVAAALALCMAGSAFAQDNRFDRGQNREDRHGRAEQRHDRGHGYDQNRYQRHDRRHDDRRGDRYGYRPGGHFDGHRNVHPRSQWRRGGHVPREYRGRNYVVSDWHNRRLQAPPRGYQWVGVNGDYVLAAVATGLIAQIIIGR